MNTERKVLVSIVVTTFLALTVLVMSAFAVPQTINYQGYIEGPGGTPVNGTVSMVFSIYNAPTGDIRLWTETQDVVVTDGAFGVALGSVTPIALPFDEQYYLGVTVGEEAEMTPRAVLVSVPYAIRAAGVDVPLELSGATSADIINGVNTGTGRAGYFQISNPASGVAAVKIDTDGGGTAIYARTLGTGRAGYFRINNASNSSAALYTATDGTGYSGYFEGGQGLYVAGMVNATGFTGDGSQLTNISGANLAVPFELNGSNASPIVSSTNTGTGKAGEFKVDNASSLAHALSATTNGNGNAVYGYTSGGNHAGYFQLDNAASNYNALNATTNGGGSAVYGLNTGTGRAGFFVINNAASTQSALMSTTNGLGRASYFHISNAANNSDALYGVTYGSGRAGYFRINNAASTASVLHAETNGTGYSGYFTGGDGIYINGMVNATGTVSATSFTGDGSQLTNINSALTTPLELSGSATSPIIRGYQTGLGTGFVFQITNPSNANHALSVSTEGNGAAISGSAMGLSPGVYGLNYGTGSAGYFVISNTANSNYALRAQTNGGGDAIYGYQTGTSRAGHFRINNPSNTQSALYAHTNGTGYSGYFEGGQGLYVAGMVNATSFTGDGSQLTNISGANLAVPFELNGSNASPIVSSTNTGTGKAGEFIVDNASSSANALYASTNGSGDAVYGYTTGTHRAGYFQVNNASSLYEALRAETNGMSDAIRAYQTGTARAGFFWISNASNINPAIDASTNGTGYSGSFSGGKGVLIAGDLNVTGTLTKGSGSFVQPHPTDPSKELVYAFFEGPEHAVFLRGTARLVDGKAVIETPEYFRVVAGQEGITVQFTPRSSDTFGLAAVDISRERIVVEELKGETHTYEFDYFITAKRAGFEGHEPIQPNTHFTANMKTAEEFEQAYAKDDMTISAMRKLLMSNGILTADGKLNMELAKELGWVVKDSDVAMHEGE